MSNANMYIGRPVIGLNDGKGQPYVGFGVSVDEGNRLVVLDYVTNTHVTIHPVKVMTFTQQRLTALFLMDKSSLFSLFFTPMREVTFKEKEEWSEQYVRAQLQINEFWERYNQYLKGEVVSENQ